MTTRQLTDPAKELADILTALQAGDAVQSGDVFISNKFGVEPWSSDYYRVVAAIMARIDLIKRIVSESDFDEDIRSDHLHHIDETSRAFSLKALQQSWSQHGSKLVAPANVRAISGLSYLVRQQVAYIKPTPEEIEELEQLASALLGQLQGLQQDDATFLRASMIEGLNNFLFRMKHFKWVGSDNALDSLRQVAAAAMALEQGGQTFQSNPAADGVLVAMKTFVRTAYSKIGHAKAVYETATWPLQLFGAYHLAKDSGIVALITKQ